MGWTQYLSRDLQRRNESIRRYRIKSKRISYSRADADFLSKNPKVRAKDINDAFADKEVKAIITTIGGDDSIRILPYLNAKIIQRNPKILLGYSDTTTLLAYCNSLGLVTYHGPSIMAGFSKMRRSPPEFKDHVKNILFRTKKYEYKPYSQWYEGYPSWTDKDNVGKTNPLKENKEGWNFLQGKKVVQGEFFGGCLEVLEFMKGTNFWPKSSFWKGKILFFETSEDKPTPDQVKYILRNYGMQGIFDKIEGMMFGRPRDYSIEEKKKLEENILEIVRVEFGRSEMPIVTNVDFGHTDPQLIVPLGVKAEINPKKRSISLLESAVL